ncbi:MAG: outer membrane beta-barrel family protein [Muribaculaceae bacterium]|nr:outer membrane beta-barrel family protein [Muribaculaceae bacterium]
MNYTGTTPSTVHVQEINSQFRFITNLMFNSIWLQGNLSLRHQYNKLNQLIKNHINPHIFIVAGMRFNARQSANMSAEYAFGHIPLSQLTPTIVQINNIDALRGNPDLGNFRMFQLSLQYQYLFSNNFAGAVHGSFHRESSIITPYYIEEQTPNGELMVRNLINAGFYNKFTYGVNLTGKFLNNHLIVHALLTGNKAARRGPVDFNGDYLTFNIDASYNLKGWYTSIFYNYRTKGCYTYGYAEKPNYYGLQIGWSNGTLNIKGSVANPFSNSWYSGYALLIDNNYRNKSYNFGEAYKRNFMINVVYTFSYGKKIKNGDEVNQLSGSSSAILK